MKESALMTLVSEKLYPVSEKTPATLSFLDEKLKKEITDLEQWRRKRNFARMYKSLLVKFVFSQALNSRKREKKRERFYQNLNIFYANISRLAKEKAKKS